MAKASEISETTSCEKTQDNTSKLDTTTNKNTENQTDVDLQDNKEEKFLLSLLPKYRMLKREDKLELNNEISQWIRERLICYTFDNDL